MSGTVTVPGSKSATNRALVLAALADGASRLSRPLRSRDTELMAAALRCLDVRVSDDGDDWLVTGGALRVVAPRVDAGNAGTVARFLPAVAALARGEVTIDGDPRIRERPLAPLLRALRELGADIDDGGRGRLPFTVRGTGGLPGGSVVVDASASSQFVSGLLLAAPRFDAGAEVRAAGRVPSAPHLAMTVSMLRRFGARVDDSAAGRWLVRPGPLRATDLAVEPDLSSAAPFLAAAVVTAGEVRVAGWPGHSEQPGAALPALLEQFGARAGQDEGGLTLRGTGAGGGLDADLSGTGELAPVLAAVAALGSRPSRLRGIAHLRGHETDRLAALARELTALGGRVRETDDGLQIDPVPLHGGRFRTYDDHRLAMAAAVLGLVVPGVEVENVETTAKTLPGFRALWERLVRGAGR